MKRLRLFFCLSVLFIYAHGQTNNLTENADAIINSFNASYVQTDINNATYKVTEVITILNKQGEEFGNFVTFGDKFTELKDFSGIIKNSSGKVIKKVGKKDLTISSISEHLNTDDYRIIYFCKQPTYPYTVEYTYVQKFKNGIISYPPFIPAPSYRVSVEEANYTLELPLEVKARYKSNYDFNYKDEKINNKQVISLSLKDMKAIDYEPASPTFRELFPLAFISPAEFCFDSHCGNMSDWNSYGQWVSSLLKGRNELPAEFVESLKTLVKDAKTDKEKVEILYKYLQDNTRYVSIQLGIGGYQPIEASKTWKSKFGDCKGLSNLMMSMLSAAGIQSNYTVIRLSEREKELYPDFPNFNQANHVILFVPLKTDSIWLECTSSTTPFGYVHDQIAGHDALVITESGGEIRKLPEYKSSQNRTNSKLEMSLDENGTATGTMSFVEYLSNYDNNKSDVMSNDRDKMVEYINGNIKLPKLVIGQITTSEIRSELPSSTLSSSFEAPDYANKTGSRLFVPICPLRKTNYNIFSASKRDHDIVLNRGFSESDTIIIQVPDMYTAESLPKNIELKNDFGIFKSTISFENNRINYSQYTEIYPGRYSKEKYKDLKEFFTLINNAINKKVVIKK